MVRASRSTVLPSVRTIEGADIRHCRHGIPLNSAAFSCRQLDGATYGGSSAVLAWLGAPGWRLLQRRQASACQ
eukprot:39057-Eustigmatos_ZCMA.PRE.1